MAKKQIQTVSKGKPTLNHQVVNSQTNWLKYTFYLLSFITITSILAFISMNFLRKTGNGLEGSVKPNLINSPDDSFDFPNWLKEPEKTSYRRVIAQVGKCPYPAEPKSSLILDYYPIFNQAQIKESLNKVLITLHYNGKKSDQVNLEIIQNIKDALKITKRKYRKIPVEEAKNHLIEMITYQLSKSSSIARRLGLIYLNGGTASFAQYDVAPGEEYEGIGARNTFFNNGIRLYAENRPTATLIPHEIAHAAASKISLNGRAPVTIQELTKMFPCNSGEAFISLWQSEMESFYTELNSKKYFESIKYYEPSFTILVNEDNFLLQQKKSNYHLGTILPKLPSNWLISLTTEKKYLEIINNSAIKIQNIHYRTDVAGLISLEITPVAMQNEAKLNCLTTKIKHDLDYIKKHHISNQCQEAYGTMLELPQAILTKFFPKSVKYLNERLNDYENEFKPQLSLRL